MKYIDCENCDTKANPFNTTIGIAGKVYCDNCIEASFPDKKVPEGVTIEKHIDSTVCAFCSLDNGEVDLDKIAEYPVCANCAVNIKNRAFPLWVKGFLAFIAAVVLFSVIWNWRFYQGYQYVIQTKESIEAGNIPLTAELFAKAAAKVPEQKDLKTLYHYYNGLNLLIFDKAKEAYSELSFCSVLPLDYNVEYYKTLAQRNMYYNDKDYLRFLNTSLQMWYGDTTNAEANAFVASAYSCLYVTEGHDSLKTKAEQYLTKAWALDATPEAAKYYRMVEYRLYAKQIVTMEEFTKKYPNGWVKPL